MLLHSNYYKVLPLNNPSPAVATKIQSSLLSHKMDFTLGDFCLSCDAQTNGTAFCSSACRLTQLDRFVGSPDSPSTSSSFSDTASMASVTRHQHQHQQHHHQHSRFSWSSSSTNGFTLPPAYDFSVHRTTSSTSLSLSLSSRPHSPKLSEQARNDLKDYVGLFDQTRTLRRKVSMVTNDDVRTFSKTR